MTHIYGKIITTDSKIVFRKPQRFIGLTHLPKLFIVEHIWVEQRITSSTKGFANSSFLVSILDKRSTALTIRGGSFSLQGSVRLVSIFSFKEIITSSMPFFDFLNDPSTYSKRFCLGMSFRIFGEASRRRARFLCVSNSSQSLARSSLPTTLRPFFKGLTFVHEIFVFSSIRSKLDVLGLPK